MPQNLLQQSSVFATAWTTSGCSITSNTADTLDPAGGQNADILVEAANLGTHFISQQPLNTYVVSGRVYTFSVFVKSASNGWIYAEGDDANAYAYFNTTTGEVGTKAATVLNTSSASYGNGWYRISITYKATSAAGFVYIVGATSGSTVSWQGVLGTKDTYLWGAQLVQANWPGEYISTLTQALGVTTPPQNIVSEGRQNLLLRSEDFANIYWVKIGMTISGNSFIEDATTSHRILPSGPTMVLGRIYTLSVLVSPGTRSYFDFHLAGFGQASFALIGNGTAVNFAPSKISIAAAIQRQPDGKYLCSYTFLATTTTTTLSIYSATGLTGADITYTGVAGDVALSIYHAQIVQANQPGDYVATTTAAIGTTTPPVNIVSEGGQNLVLRSEDPTLNWTLVNVTSSAAGDVPPVGPGITAVSRFIEAIGTFAGRSVAQAVTLTSGTPLTTLHAPIPWTFSVYAKAGSRNWIALSTDSGGVVTSFDVGTGVIGARGASHVADIQPAGNGWYRCSVTKVAAAGTTVGVGFWMLSANNTFAYTSLDGTGYVIVGGMQLTQGNQPGDYIATTAAAVGPVTPPINLVSEGGQNLLIQSSAFADAAWTLANCTITSDVIANPLNGAMDADAIVEANAAGGALTHTVSATTAPSTVAGRLYTLSWFAKAGARSWCALQIASAYCYFGLTGAGAVGTVAGTINNRISAVGSTGWYRCSVSYAATTATSAARIYSVAIDSVSTYTSVDGQIAVYAYGAQLTHANQPGDYVATTTAAIGASAAPINASASVNLLQQSYTLQTSPWATTQSSAVALANQETNPLTGLLTAVRLTDATTISQAFHFWGQSFTALPFGIYTFSAIVKTNAATRWLDLVVLPGVNAYVDILNGVRGALTGTGALAHGIEPVVGAAGWYKVWVTVQAAPVGCQIYFANASGGASYGTAAAGYSCFVAAAKFEPGYYGGVDWTQTTTAAFSATNTNRATL